MTAIIRQTDVLGGGNGTNPCGIHGGFEPFVSFNGYRRYEVAETYTDPNGIDRSAIRLVKVGGPSTDTLAQIAARTADGFVDRPWPYGDSEIRGSFPHLAWYLLDPATLALVKGPLASIGFRSSISILGKLVPVTQALAEITPATQHVIQWDDTSLPSVGTEYYALLVSREPSEAFPLFVRAHPVDQVAFVLGQKSLPYDATSAQTVRAAIGPIEHVRAITDPDETPQQVVDAFSEAYGFTLRRGVAGISEFVRWREKLAALPSAVLDMNSIRAEGGPTFSLADATRITRVRVAAQVLAPWDGTTETRTGVRLRRFLGIPYGTKTRTYQVPSTNKPASGLQIGTSEPLPFDYSTDGVTPDADTYGEQEQDIQLLGCPAWPGGVYVNLEQFGEGIARKVFDAHARGRQMATAVLIRGSAAERVSYIGDPVTLHLDHSPNAQLGQSPTSQRGGQRPFRVVERTDEMPGPVVTYADEGTGVAYGEVPTPLSLTIVRSSTSSIGLQVLVGNSTQLTADKAQVEFEVAVFKAGQTVDLSSAGFSYWVDDATTWGATDPWPLRIEQFPVSAQVFIRARAWLIGGAAGAWSNWFGFGGEITGPQTTLSDLQISAVTDDGATLTWSYDESPPVGSVLVQYRETQVGGGYTTFATLAAGTETDDLTGLTADTQYDVRIVLDNGGEYGDVLLGQFQTLAGSLSSLVVGTPTSDGVALSWTNSDASNLVRVQVKEQADSTYITIVDLPPASIAYTLSGLLPSTAYDVRVVLVDPFTLLEIGSALTDQFTTASAGSQLTLSTPTNATAYGAWNPITQQHQPGMYALSVVAVFGPPGMEIVFHEAVETAVGSGTPGSYSEVARVPAVVSGPTYYIATAPNDGKLRYLKARAEATSYTASSFTSALAVDPWPDTPTTGTDATVTPGTGVLRAFGWAPAISTTAPAGSYTDEQAQDAVGSILTDTATIDFTYTDATPEITADVIPGGVDIADLGGYPGGSTTFLRADGTFAVPGSTAGSIEPLEYSRRLWLQQVQGSASAFETLLTPSSITGVGTSSSGDLNGFRFLSIASGAVSGNAASQIPTNMLAWYTTTNAGIWVFRFATVSSTDLTSVRFWAGMFSASPTASDTPAVDLAAFRFSTGAGDTDFMACTSDGTSITATSTGITPAADTIYLIRIEWDTTNSEVRFYVNGTLTNTLTTNLPNASMAPIIAWTTLTNSARSFRYGRQWGAFLG